MINFSLFKSRYSLGIYIGINSASAILLKQNRTGNSPVKQHKINFSTRLNTEASYQHIQKSLESLLEYFNEELGYDYIPVQFSLADALVNSAIFELDQIPPKPAIKDQLITMRFQKDCHINMQNAAVSSQVIKQKKQQALYAITAPKDLVSLIQAVMQRKKLNLYCMDKAIHYIFNYYYEELSAEAAMLFHSNEYWTLIIWDSNKNVVYFRSKLHSENEAYSAIAEDVLRLLHTYQQHDQQQLKQLYIIESGASTDSLSETIRRREDIAVSPLSLLSENEQLQILPNDPALFTAEPR